VLVEASSTDLDESTYFSFRISPDQIDVDTVLSSLGLRNRRAAQKSACVAGVVQLTVM
jgi:hypothetical protein